MSCFANFAAAKLPQKKGASPAEEFNEGVTPVLEILRSFAANSEKF